MLFLCKFISSSTFVLGYVISTSRMLVSSKLYCIFWWQMFFNNSFHISSHGAVINFPIWAFRFLQTILLINSISLCFDPWILSHPLTNWFPSFWLFLVLFWMLRMLVIVFKSCHAPHASRIRTWRTLFTERLLSVSKVFHGSATLIFRTLYPCLYEVFTLLDFI